MRRFTELVLIVTCTLPLLFVNGFQALQPSIKNDSLRTDAVIRGLLVPRQFFCQSGFGLCESRFCCPINWNCCRNGSCCQPSFYCVIGSNGVVGCCPNGRICSGPIGEPTTINNPPPPPPRTTNIPPPPPPPPPPTNNPPPPPPPPTNNPLPPPPTTTTHPSSISTSTSTTSTSLLGGPTQSVENQIIDVSVLDVNIKWSENWVLQTSSCDPSIKSKITSTGNSSFTYLSNDIVTSSGYFYYINVANSNTEWEVLVNGVSQNTYFSNSSGFTNCTYLKSSNLIHTQLDVSQNITIVVLGLESETLDRSSTSDPWSLEVNMLLIQEQDSSESSGSATSSFTQNTAIPTLTSAAGRAQPYRPLLVPGSILLATVISILRV